MRLIDADKLLEPGYTDMFDVPIRFAMVSRNAIETAPTVKAIPIEWIKNYARHKASKGFTEIDCYWQYWEEDVLKMVADWEKENEESLAE